MKWPRRLLSIGFAITGVGIAAFSIAMVAIYGATLGAAWLDQIIYGGAHVAIHCFSILAALSVSILIADRFRVMTALVIGAIFLSALYGITNMIGFAAKSRFAVVSAVNSNNDRAWDKYRREIADLTERRNHAEAQAMSYDHSKAERAGYRRQQAEYQQRVSSLAPPIATAANVMADGSATILAEMISVPVLKVQVALAVPVAVLSYLLEALSFMLAVRIWRGPDGPDMSRSKADMSQVTADIKPDEPQSEPERGVVTPFPKASPRTLPAATLKSMSTALALPDEQADMIIQTANLPPPLRDRPSKLEALNDLHRIIAYCGVVPSQNFLARRWRMKRQRVHDWVREFEAYGQITRRWVGRRQEIGAAQERTQAAA